MKSCIVIITLILSLMNTGRCTLGSLIKSGDVSCPYYDLVPKDFDANVAFRIDILNQAGTDAAAASEFKLMCSKDILFYINTFGFTYDPRKVKEGLPTNVPFITYDFQDTAMVNICDCIFSGEDFTIPKSRDMGASWMNLTCFEWIWHFKMDLLSFLMISRNEDYVDQKGNPKALFWKIDFLHKNQPRWLLPTGRWLGDKDPNRKKMHLRNADNGNVIDGESTTGDAGRGDRRMAMFIDEHAAFERNDGFKVLNASRDTTNCRGFNSTPQGGTGTAFYEVCHNTAAREIRLHWSVHPEKNKGLYQTGPDGRVELLDNYRGIVSYTKKGEKKRLVKFPEEYPFRLDGKLRSPWFDGECARCVNEKEIAQELNIDFFGSDFLFFDADFIESVIKKYCIPPYLVGDLEYTPETCEPKRFVENPKGNLLLWITLDGDGHISSDRKFVLGSDVSAGTGASNSVTSIVDQESGEKIGVWINSETLPIPFCEQTIALAKFFNNGLMIWDGSGPTGEVFKKHVVSVGYSNIYYRRNEKKIGRPISDEPGYWLNGNARTTLLQDYRHALGTLRFINRSKSGMEECLQFIRKADGTIEHRSSANTSDPSGAKSAHGDEVIADALASIGLEEVKTIREQEEPSVPEGSLAWRRNRKAESMKISDDGLSEGWA